MDTLIEATVAREPCGNCPSMRVTAVEIERANHGPDLVSAVGRVTVLSGCAACEGATGTFPA